MGLTYRKPVRWAMYTFMTIQDDAYWMHKALDEAQKAASIREVPVGAIVVCDGVIVGRGHNLRESHRDPTAHAEMVAIRAAASSLDRWRLSDCTLYVTLEPCPMCAGAIVNSRIERLVFGARDPRAGAVRSVYQICDDPRLNHRSQITSGIEANACSDILSAFFASRRAEKKALMKTSVGDASGLKSK